MTDETTDTERDGDYRSIDIQRARKERGLLETDNAEPCVVCGNVVFNWWEGDTCGDCETTGDDESGHRQQKLVTDGGTPATAVDRDTTTFLTQSGIQERMMCSGSTAARIEDAFVTVEQLLDAAGRDEPLTNVDGIGSATAGVIQEWYENRENRERMASGATVERTSAKSMMIKNNGDWSDALGIEITEGDDE